MCSILLVYSHVIAAIFPVGQKGGSVTARGVGVESVEPKSDDGEFAVCFTRMKYSLHL